VIDQRIFQFTLMEIGNWVEADQGTGRVIHIPNGKVFTDVQANYTKGFEHIWDELPVLVTFESNWQAAKQILEEALAEHAEHISEEASERIRRAARRFMIFYRKLGPIVYTSVADSGVLLTMRYLVGARQRRGTREAIWEHILAAFAKRDDIDFAYPTTRFYDNRSEGKPGTTPGGRN
jgi:small-conductance mechanosensitive channel